MRKLAKDGLAVVAGALGTISMAPFHFSYLAILSALLFIFCLEQGLPTWRAAWRGWLYGIGLFLSGCSWVYVSIANYSSVGFLGAVGLACLLAAILALVPLTKAVVLRRFFKLELSWVLVTAVPALWVLCDWLQSFLFTGFPWLYLGYSQITTPLAGFAPILSVYGVTLVIVLLAALLMIALRTKSSSRYLSIAAIIIIFAFGLVLHKVPWTQRDGKAFKVGLVQGDVAMNTKWDPERFLDNIQHYEKLSAPLLADKTRLIVWPETAVPILAHKIPQLLSDLDKQAKQADAGLVFGIPLQFRNQYFNSMLGLGLAYGVYSKRHLVPFGEYWPSWSELFGRWLNLPMSSFTAGKQEQKLMRFDNIPFVSLICYEIAFPELVREGLPWAQFIISVSDASWFGHSMAKYQMLDMARMRAIETGRYFLNVDNSGVTAIIGPKGSILAQATPNRATTVSAKIYAMQGATPWVSDGIHLIGIVVLLLLAVAIFMQTRRRSGQR